MTILIILFLLKLPNIKTQQSTFKQQVSQLDPIGTALFIPGIVCLLLALQWGGTKYAWGSGPIIALLVLFGILIIAFIGVQVWKQDTATVPPRIIKRRSVAAGVFYIFCVGGSMLTIVYWLPVWFQASMCIPFSCPESK